MRFYKVEGGVAHVGTDMLLELTPQQVAARAHILEEVEGGWRARAPLQFKAGEIIGIDCAPENLPRPLAVNLISEGDEVTVSKKPKPAGKRRATA